MLDEILRVEGLSKQFSKKNKLPFSILSDPDGKVAKQYEVEVQIRPKHLADDYASTTDVFEYVISQNSGFEYACMIYATAPFLEVKYLKEGFDRLKNSNSCYSFGATTYDFSIFRGFEIVDNKAKMFWPENLSKRSQDLKEAYHDVGQFYWKKLNCKEKFSFDGNIPILIPRCLTQDIDTLEDFERAENLYKVIYPNKFDKWNSLKQKLNQKDDNLFIKNADIITKIISNIFSIHIIIILLYFFRILAPGQGFEPWNPYGTGS